LKPLRLDTAYEPRRARRRARGITPHAGRDTHYGSPPSPTWPVRSLKKLTVAVSGG